MADVSITMTVKDSNGNLGRIIDNIDKIFPGRDQETEKEWIKKKLKTFLIEKVKSWECGNAALVAIDTEKLKEDLIIE